MSRAGLLFKGIVFAGIVWAGVGSTATRGSEVVPESKFFQQYEGSIYRQFLSAHYGSPRAPQSSTTTPKFVAPAPLSISSLEISADTATGRFRQDEPVVGRFSTGSYLVAWRDPANGTDEVFSRAFDAGLMPLGGGTPLFSDAVDRSPQELAADCDGSAMMVGWVDGSSPRFVAAFTDAAGTVLSSAPVDETGSAQFIGSPDVARLYPSGFVSVWEEFRLGGWRIFGQRFSSSAMLQGSNVIISTGPDSLLKLSPAAAGDTAGGYIIAWSEGNASRCDVHARLFSSAGVAVGSELTITSPSANESYMLPRAVYVDSVHEYWVTYVQTDDPADSTLLWLQRVSVSGNLIGAATSVEAGPYPWSPQISLLGSDVLIATERFDNLAEIRTLRISPLGVILDSTAVINGASIRARNDVAVTSSGDTLGVIWSDRVSGTYDIHGRLRAAAGFASDDQVLSASAPGGQQTYVSIAERAGGGVLAVFQDEQLDDGDISLVDIAEDGSILSRRLANDDGTLSAQYDAHVVADTSGRNLVTWTDERTDWTGPVRHVAGRFMQAGAFQGPVIRLAEDTTTSGSLQFETNVSMNANGRSAVVWIDTRSDTSRSFMRRFESNNTASTGDVLLNDGGLPQISIAQELAPAVSLDSSGGVWTAWTVLDGMTDSFFVLAQAWDTAGNRRGPTFDLSPMGRTAAAVDFDILAAHDGRLRLVWYDRSSMSIWSHMYDTAGTALGVVQRVSDSGVVATSPSMNQDARSDQWCISWTQQSGSYEDVLWRRFNGDGIPAAPVEQISSSMEQASVRSGSRLAYGGTFLYGAWHDNESAGEGFNVRLSAMLKTAASVSDDHTIRPDEFVLYPNFPNPFNPKTKIRFVLDAPALVQLDVIDVLGRNVVVLATGVRGPGKYELTWNGTDHAGREVASGLYFYRLQAGATTQTRKMLLLR
jgi:hypothetical protein